MTVTRHSGPKKAKPCPGCGRPGAECWVMPCLYLELVLQQGRGAVARWARVTGGKMVRK